MKNLATHINESFVNESKKTITVIVYNDKKIEYSKEDIQELIDDIDDYIGSDNLPKWLITSKIAKNKSDVLKILQKVIDHKNDVVIDVDSNKPMKYQKTIIYK